MFAKFSKSLKGQRGSAVRRACVETLEERQLLSAAPTLWADDTQGRLFTVNVGSGQVHVVGQMPTVMYDIAFDPHGNLYGVDGDSALWRINSTNAAATRVGSLGTSVNSLVFSGTGVLYAAGSSLYRVSTANGHASAVGNQSLNGFSSAGDLAFDSSGTLYLSTNSDDLVRVNTSTGGATRIGSLGFDQVYGMAFGPDHVLYGLSNTTEQIFSINLANGHGTLKASFANKGVDGVNGSTFITEAAPARKIEVDGRSLKIADGDTTPSTTDDTDFGSVVVNSGSVTHTFTIRNNTGATLHLTGTPRVKISGVNAADFVLLTAPAASVAPGGTTTFTVRFTPHGVGARTAVVTIPNSDASDGSYHFSIRGNGATTKPAATVIYAADDNGNLFTVNASTGQTHVIGHMPQIMFDIAFNKNGALYGIDGSNEVWSINPNNAAISFVGSLNVRDEINSLTFAADGTLYAAGTDLYAINLTTHQFFDRGTMGGFTSAGDLAFDKSGRLLLSTTSDELLQVNPLNAHVTPIGPIGFSQVLGLAEGPDGVLYGMSDTTDQIFSINPVTGHGTNPVHFTGVIGVYGATVKPV